VKADLYNAAAQAIGTGGLVQRTEAGFVIAATNDAAEVIDLVNAGQNDPDLIDQVVARVQSSEPQAFSMLFTAGGELYLIISGLAHAVVNSDSTTLSIEAKDAAVAVVPVNTGVTESAAQITLTASTGSSDAPVGLDLGAGASAAGVELAFGGATLATPAAVEPEPEPEPEAAPPTNIAAAVAPAEASALAEVAAPAEPVPALVAQETPAEPAESAQVQPEKPASIGPVTVLGVSCPQGHHNHPDAVYCSQCGTKMGVHATMVLTDGPRPSLGVLVVDDGTTYALNEDLIIGREPTSHGDVVAGTAAPMTLVDDTLALSRQHARIVLDDWSVALRDLNSSNGTYLSRAGSGTNWTKVESGSEIPLEPGDRIRVGGRIIQVELHHVRG
jgi:hypothetical protein